MAYIKAYENHVEDLVKCLPMDDTHFVTSLSSHQLLPGDTRDKIEAQATQAKKASYFLNHVIKTALDIKKTDNFQKLLSIMQDCGYHHVQSLSFEIKSEIEIDKASEIKTDISSITGNIKHAYTLHLRKIHVKNYVVLGLCGIAINSYSVFSWHAPKLLLSRKSVCVCVSTLRAIKNYSYEMKSE